MSAFTPGPFRIVASRSPKLDERGDFAIVDSDNRTIAETYKYVGEVDGKWISRPARDNAILFAAAPELLQALKDVIAVADRKTDEFDAARAAVAKAEGRE